MSRRIGDALYLTDAEIARRLGFSEDYGRRLLHDLDKAMPGRAPYPKRDPLFGGRRFWPAVLKWHMEYHGISPDSHAGVAPVLWEEHFDEPSEPASRSKNARPHLAKT